MAMFNLNPAPLSLDQHLRDMKYEFVNMLVATIEEVNEQRAREGATTPLIGVTAQTNNPKYTLKLTLDSEWEQPNIMLENQPALIDLCMYIQRLISDKRKPLYGLIQPDVGTPYFLARITDEKQPSPRYLVRAHGRVPGTLNHQLTLYIGHTPPDEKK
jgi:hypothetical protein